MGEVPGAVRLEARVLQAIENHDDGINEGELAGKLGLQREELAGVLNNLKKYGAIESRVVGNSVTWYSLQFNAHKKVLIVEDDPNINNLVKVSLGGGMAVIKSVADRWKQVTGCTLVEAYGLSETSPAATINPLDLKEYNGAIGLPISSTEISIRGEDGKEVPTGQPGEICIRGPQVMAGYWQRPDETAKAMTADGYFCSGDVGIMDEMGYVRIVDRKKDMVVVSGFKVYPNEIESVVSSHPGVLECAAIGVPDAHSGEAVKLFVVKKDPALTEEALRKYCEDNFAGYKRPRQIEFRKELPKTNVGKILRRALRDEKKE